MFKILIAEDEPNIRHLIAKNLTNAGYTAIECENGKRAINTFYNEHIDLVITDVMMPLLDGNMLTFKIREINRDIPILMLTVLDGINDKEKGFNLGVDDYITKPVIMKELVLRVKALLRRYKINNDHKIEIGTTILNYSTNSININGVEVNLTKKEFMLLFKLLSNPNIIMSREHLMKEIWGYDSESGDRTIDTHIRWLRDKALSPDYEIITVRGLGYKAVINEST